MTVSKGTRVGLTRWSADTDPWSREDWDGDNALLEDLVAIDLQVADLAARPLPGEDLAGQPADTRGRYCYVEDPGKLYRDTGAAWVAIGPNPVERYSLLIVPGVSTVLAAGWHPAGRDATYKDADTEGALDLPSWLTVETAPAHDDAGLLALAAGDYIVSLTMRLDDPSSTTTFPDGSVWTQGYTLTTSPAMLAAGPQNVAPPLTMSAAIRALGYHSLNQTVHTAGGRWVKPYVYMGAGAGANRQHTMRVDVTKLA